MRHEPVVFECGGAQLLGIIEHAEHGDNDIGVLIVTGGPQYRIGSHRQFVVIARALAAKGIATMRFDYRGMGDSTGPVTSFDRVSDDIRAAADAFVRHSTVQRIVLWGLCDAASACMIYAPSDPRVCSLIALNPWVRSDQGLARAYVKHYYWRRFVSRGFWTKVLAGRLSARRAISELSANLRESLFARSIDPATARSGSALSDAVDFRERMLEALKRFRGSVLLILCGKDLTAAEFHDFAMSQREWQLVISRSSVVTRELPDADHTFSRTVWREEVIQSTIDWVRGLASHSSEGTRAWLSARRPLA